MLDIYNPQRVIMFVGADMCGKTQIAKELSRIAQIPYFKATSEHTTFLSSRYSVSDQFINQLRFADPRVFDLLKQTRHSVIFDRAYPCEYAYSKVLGRETDLTMLQHVDESWASIGTKIVFCQRSSYAGIKDDLDPTIGEEHLRQLHEAYEQFAKWTKCKLYVLNVDDENLTREVDEVLTKVLDYTNTMVWSMRKQADDQDAWRPQVTCNNGSTL